jgi:hypothetical protein
VERYYRIKESFRDLIGRNHSRILLSVGFITPESSPEDIRDIGRCLNWLQSHRNEQDLFGDAMSRYKEFVRRKAREYWDEMVRKGSLDAVDATVAAHITLAHSSSSTHDPPPPTPSAVLKAGMSWSGSMRGRNHFLTTSIRSKYM